MKIDFAYNLEHFLCEIKFQRYYYWPCSSQIFTRIIVNGLVKKNRMEVGTLQKKDVYA